MPAGQIHEHVFERGMASRQRCEFALELLQVPQEGGQGDVRFRDCQSKLIVSECGPP